MVYQLRILCQQNLQIHNIFDTFKHTVYILVKFGYNKLGQYTCNESGIDIM